MKITIEITQEEVNWLTRFLGVQIAVEGITVEKDGAVSGLHPMDKILIRVHYAALAVARQEGGNEFKN